MKRTVQQWAVLFIGNPVSGGSQQKTKIIPVESACNQAKPGQINREECDRSCKVKFEILCHLVFLHG
jgi:hypothetical protein